MDYLEQKFLDACSLGKMDKIDSLLEDGVDIDCCPYDQDTSGLMQACMNETSLSIDVVLNLIHRGADVNITDDDGNNALDTVLGWDVFCPQIASLLLVCSKDGINRVDTNQMNYLWACRTLESYKFIVENGIDINHVAIVGHIGRDPQYQTALDDIDSEQVTVFGSQEQKDQIITYLESKGGKRYREL